MKHRRAFEPRRRQTPTHEVRARCSAILGHEHRPIDVQEARHPDIELNLVSTDKILLGRNERPQDIVHRHLRQERRATRHVRHEHNGLDVLQNHGIAQVTPHHCPNQEFAAVVVTVREQRGAIRDGEWTAIQLATVHPRMQAGSQEASVIAFLVTVAAGADDDPIAGVNPVTLDALQNAGGLQLIKAVSEGGQVRRNRNH